MRFRPAPVSIKYARSLEFLMARLTLGIETGACSAASGTVSHFVQAVVYTANPFRINNFENRA